MISLLKSFWKEEDALGTVEMVLILAVLVSIALLFGGTVKGWVEDNLQKAMPNDLNIDNKDYTKQNQ